MRQGIYRLTVIVCALSWFLVGLHLPAVHQMTHHGARPAWSVIAVVALLAIMAVAGIWRLLRAPSAWTARSGSSPVAR